MKLLPALANTKKHFTLATRDVGLLLFFPCGAPNTPSTLEAVLFCRSFLSNLSVLRKVVEKLVQPSTRVALARSGRDVHGVLCRKLFGKS